ncbi:hypothetical protein BDW59DRAFT_8743 [Aspergillus cavernicola]|uniref:UBX domain-containing protein n=1 Tax=Aspergillus cavernicola TaxID=176166 RepID=A0ABR4IVD8_9EURO
MHLLETRSVLLRITKDSPEAGFLASVCPVSQYPTVVVIRNGMLREYIVPNVSKDEFHSRLAAVLEETMPQAQTFAPWMAQQTPAQSPEADSSPAEDPEPVTIPLPTAAAAQSPSNQGQPEQDVARGKSKDKGNKPVYEAAGGSRSSPAQAPRKHEEHKIDQTINNAKQNQKSEIKKRAPTSRIPNDEKAATESSASRPTPAPGPPAQYRLQVRLFDGSSVRSTFSPSHTIRKEVRHWLDSQMEEKRPYNLKHILTPLPNQTLTIADEDQSLRELIAGSTATFVMVPIKTYIEAYSDSGPLPVRAASSVYGLVSSVIGTATGYASSLLGYVQTQAVPSQSDSTQSTESQPSNDTQRRPRAWGPNIRTLRDQEDQDKSQFYNGNQLNFEPRRDNEQ